MLWLFSFFFNLQCLTVTITGQTDSIFFFLYYGKSLSSLLLFARWTCLCVRTHPWLSGCIFKLGNTAGQPVKQALVSLLRARELINTSKGRAGVTCQEECNPWSYVDIQKHWGGIFLCNMKSSSDNSSQIIIFWYGRICVIHLRVKKKKQHSN